MADFLVLWGVSQAFSLVFVSILQELAKGAAEDYVKDFFKSCLSKIYQLSEKETQQIQIATGKALTEFLRLIEQELQDADLEYIEIQQYNLSVEEFIKDKEVAAALGETFVDQSSLNAKLLKDRWQKLEVRKTLPDQFNWEQIAKRYPKKVQAIIQETPELREILNSQNLAKLADNVPVQPEFDLIKHQEGILEQYGNLKLPRSRRSLYGLVTNGSNFVFLKLSEQNGEFCYDRSQEFVLENQEDLPKVLQVIKRLANLISE